MIDVETTIFDRLADVFDAKYPNGSRYGEQQNTPANFPCFTCVEIDNHTYEQSLDADMVEHDAHLTYEINVYSNKVNGAKFEAKNVMALLDTEMLSMGFVRDFCEQTRNMDTRVYRLTARYRAVISEDYRIYRR